MTHFSPREIVSELDRYIVGQEDAKRAVAIALRNRWRRQQLVGDLKEEVLPKNILMIGPTGVGKTEISRRLAKLAGAPFIKVEATKFTEVGYVGRDVDSIIRDLVEVGARAREGHKAQGGPRQAEKNAEERVLDALVGATSSPATRETFRKRLRARRAQRQGNRDPGRGDGRRAARCSTSPARRAPPSAPSTSATCSARRSASARKPRRVTVSDSYDVLIAEESDKLIDGEQLTGEAIDAVENNGIVFLDEIDKICSRTDGTAHRRRRFARGRAARSAAADRGHDRLHQVRAGEDRPRAVHRLGCVPRGQALRPAARAAGAPADPRRTEAADARGPAPHPDRAGGEPHQAVRGADGDRGRRPQPSPTTPSTRWRTWRCRSTRRSRTSARAGCRR